MSLEQAVVQLEQTNAALQEEVVRFRDAAMGLNAVYSTTTEGRQNTADGKYFSVPGSGAYMRLYRRNGSSAELIAEYPSRESMVAAINEATADAEARANAAADRAEVYADNKEFVTLERFRKQATLDLDFGAGDYSVDDGDKLRTTNATDLLTVERATSKWVEGPNGKLREVPPNTIARQWNPETGEPEGVLIEESRTNLLLWSEDFGNAYYNKLSGAQVLGVTSTAGGVNTNTVELSGDETSRILVPGFTHSPPLLVYSFEIRKISGPRNTLMVALGRSGAPTIQKTFPVSEEWSKVVLIFESEGFDFSSFNPVRALVSAEGDTVVEIRGAQLEEGSSPSSYMPTQDAPVTRAADRVTRALGEEFNPTEGTIYVKWLHVFPNDSLTRSVLKIRNDAYGRWDSLGVEYSGHTPTGLRLGARGEAYGGFQSTVTVDAAEGVNAVAIAYKADGMVTITLNGQLLPSDAVGGGFSAFLRELNEITVGDGLRLAGGASDEGRRSNQPLLETRLIPRALSEQEIIELTS